LFFQSYVYALDLQNLVTWFVQTKKLSFLFKCKQITILDWKIRSQLLFTKKMFCSL